MITFFVSKRVNTKRPDEAPLYYPVRASGSVVKLEEMCKAIAEKTTLTRADVHGTLCAIEEQIVKHVKEGHIVKFGMLGTFRPSVSSDSVLATDTVGVEAMKKQPSIYVKRVRVRFSPSQDLLTRVNVDARFERVDCMPKKGA